MNIVSKGRSLNNEEQYPVLVHKINAFAILINLTRSRIALLEANIQQGNETSGRSLTQGVLLDITNVNSGCKKKISIFWSAVQHFQITAAGFKSSEISTLAHSLISSQTSCHLDILSGGSWLALTSEQLKNLYYEQKNEERAFVNRQGEVLELIGDVRRKKEEVLKLEGKQLEKMKGKISKIQTARVMINSFLSNVAIDFEQHPELLEIKEYWRQPIEL